MAGNTYMTRRSFLAVLIKSIAGIRMYSLIPIGMPELTLSGLNQEIRPYWLRVLSKGIDYFPEHIRAFFQEYRDEDMVGSMQFALNLTLRQNKRALSKRFLPPEKEMNEMIENNKASQYFFQFVKETNISNNALPEIIYGNDPYYSLLLYDLSTFILRSIMAAFEEDKFRSLNSFDINLLNSSLSYLEEAINVSEHVYILSNEDFRTKLKMNLGSYYNSLGLTMSYLGDTTSAQKMYLRALEFRPGDTSILRNMGRS
jgi:tetratricopeptide (TPR) repeat protein